MNKKLKDIKQQAKRLQIIEAAARLMVQKGVEQTSLSDIANEAGISKGSLYYYYASKDDLIFDIADAHINRISENLFSIIEARKGNADWKEVLKILFERIMAAETRGRLHIYLIQQALNGNDALMERFQKKYREWYEMMRDGFEKIEPGSGDYTKLSLLIVASLDGFLIQSLLGLSTVTADEFVNHLNLQR
ncbi:MAG: TetR/AcrR family transcriptional regulator [Desulfobacterales bacterium]|nr:TetR/AcrR family transcriptional regulator [Desulfobacterales bacterium]